MEKQWVLYMLECKDGSLYTGITDNLSRRIQMHESGKGAKYTRGRAPLKLVYSEICESHSQALKREYAVKSLSRDEKLQLCDVYIRKAL
ncbi:MAG: GIY-YIG nuclease family protein [Oscillospiraceae bacterium]|nr:GIY-YIG nuclease family protein [Oscillospiraceae bacterium]